ncbi:TetR/AcrR family transcriptional regulator [Antrihabitans sp. YC2-6]|nr:TetR/AcrR family transcriptional regulator [Antrihabitans sp. YC2-6]
MTTGKEVLTPRQKAAQTKERQSKMKIVRAAVELARRSKPITLERLLARARVGSGTFYKYFENMDELLGKLADLSQKNVNRRIERECHGVSDPRVALLICNECLIEQISKYPGLYLRVDPFELVRSYREGVERIPNRSPVLEAEVQGLLTYHVAGCTGSITSSLSWSRTITDIMVVDAGVALLSQATGRILLRILDPHLPPQGGT